MTKVSTGTFRHSTRCFYYIIRAEQTHLRSLSVVSQFSVLHSAPNFQMTVDCRD